MMKDYKEVAENVLRRGLEEMERSRKRKRALVRVGCAVAVCGLAVAASMGMFLGKARPDAEEPSAGIVDEGGNSGKDAEGFEGNTKKEEKGFGANDAADTGNLSTGNVDIGEGSGLDGGQGALLGEDLTGKDSSGKDDMTMSGDPAGYGVGAGMDGDPAGYGTGAGKNAIGYLGDASGDAPAPGGKTDDMTDGIKEGQFDPESTKPATENSYPAWTQNSNDSAPVPNDSAFAREESAVMSGGAVIADADHPFSDSETAYDADKPAPNGEVDTYGETGTTPPKEMISSYPEDTIYCYMAPGNGEFFCSAPLVHAMEEYGDEVLYRVIIDIFHDGYAVRKQVTDRISGEEKLEWDRLGELGYTVAWENYDDGETKRHYFMIHATKEQLEEFAVNEEYGYIIHFFDEP